MKNETTAAIRNPVMTLITTKQRVKLLESGQEGMTPIVKIFGGSVTWLLTGESNGYFFGYVDLGMGCVEWGTVISVKEISTLRVQMGIYPERDLHYTPKNANFLDMESLVGV